MDWDDDRLADSSRGRATRVKTPKRRTDGPVCVPNATVLEVYPKCCRVRVDSSGAEPLCQYRRASNLFRSSARLSDENGGETLRERAPVAVGDRVQVQTTGSSDGVVESLAPRRNALMRRAPGRDALQQTVAANVDLLVIVASAEKPEFSPGLVDRFLIASLKEKITPVLCISKLDIAAGVEILKPWHIYSRLGVKVIETSARSRAGIDLLIQEITGKSVVFCGQSGVGKTSLLRALLGNNVGRVSELSESTGKGVHTTTSAISLPGPADSHWIDTPGIREFGITDLNPENLSSFFPEFGSLSCSLADPPCLHVSELAESLESLVKHCKALQLPRYSNYLRIFESLKQGEG